MATPQWILVQNRLEPSQKPGETQFELNSKRRQREAVRSAIKRGVLRVLDQGLVTEFTGIADCNEEDKEQIQYLSLPSLSIQSIDELVILSSPNLTILNIPCNFVSDLRPLQSCIHLIKLDASVNQIQELPDEKFWSALVSLKILYLHGNLVSQKDCLLELGGCPQLQVLTLYDTPVSVLSNYRHVAANCILTLKALDYHVISDEEIIANLQLQGKFRALARSFHKLLYLPLNKNDDFTTEMKRVYGLLLMVDIVQSHYSPVILIQRWVRGWLTRIKISKIPHLNVILKRRRQRKSYTNLKNVLTGSQSTTIGRPMYSTSTDSWLLQPPPPPTTPNLSKASPTALNFHFLRRPDTSELAQAIMDARSVLRNDRTSKKINKKGNNVFRQFPPPPAKKQSPDSNKTGVKNKVEEEREEEGEGELSISGRHCSVEHLNKLEELKTSIKESSKDIKKAKKEIKTIVKELQETPPIIINKSEPSGGDIHRFIRNHATMNLSTLRKLEKRYRYDRKTSELAVKSDLVAQVRHEREVRKERLQSYQQMIKENVLNWKLEEERRLEKEKLKHDVKREEDHLKRVANVEIEVQVTKQKIDNEDFAMKFRHGHIKIEKGVTQKKRQAQKKEATQNMQEFVQTLRETESERQEIAKSYMKEREKKLKREIMQDKNDLNAQMIQLASQQMMEAKQKVAKEKARKQAAQDNSPLIINLTPGQDLNDAYHSIPKATIADTGLLGPLLRACESYTCSPKSMRGRTLGSHRTWQRGSQALGGLHFPEIGRLPEDTPLMYDMYRPLPQHWRNVGTTPCNSPLTSLRNTVVAGSPVVPPVVLTAGTSNLYSTVGPTMGYTRDDDRQLVNLLTYSL